MESVTAIITARGGSKGIPGKNIIEVNGKPLIAYTIEAALNCSMIGECYVTTDDNEIKRVGLRYGAEIIDRPSAFATDDASSQDAVSHALDQLSTRGKTPEYFALLQPTSPLRTSTHITQCIELFFLVRQLARRSRLPQQ